MGNPASPLPVSLRQLTTAARRRRVRGGLWYLLEHAHATQGGNGIQFQASSIVARAGRVRANCLDCPDAFRLQWIFICNETASPHTLGTTKRAQNQLTASCTRSDINVDGCAASARFDHADVARSLVATVADTGGDAPSFICNESAGPCMSGTAHCSQTSTHCVSETRGCELNALPAPACSRQHVSTPQRQCALSTVESTRLVLTSPDAWQPAALPRQASM